MMIMPQSSISNKRNHRISDYRPPCTEIITLQLEKGINSIQPETESYTKESVDPQFE